MSELSRLLVKAVRALSQEEQDTVLGELLDARLQPFPQAEPARLPELLHSRGGFGVTLPSQELGVEGGPWQTVPVRLSTEQHERLKQWCQANGFTMAVVLRGLVARFLDAESRRARPGEVAAGEPKPGEATG
jgi:hypothetical protein